MHYSKVYKRQKYCFESCYLFYKLCERKTCGSQRSVDWHVVMSIRPGNVSLTNVGKSFPAVYSLLQLCGT